jgi:hypothetical protein
MAIAYNIHAELYLTTVHTVGVHAPECPPTLLHGHRATEVAPALRELWSLPCLLLWGMPTWPSNCFTDALMHMHAWRCKRLVSTFTQTKTTHELSRHITLALRLQRAAHRCCVQCQRLSSRIFTDITPVYGAPWDSHCLHQR